MNIAGECKTCGYLYDVTTTVGCPACRAARVAETFRPIDPLRTSLGMMGERPKNALEYERMRDALAWQYMRGARFISRYPGKLCTPNDEELAEVPKGCKIPKDEAEQIYQLRRLFRL